jgi:hypothetical protein
MNRFSAADWAIVVGYFALTAAIGFMYTRRAARARASSSSAGGTSVVARRRVDGRDRRSPPTRRSP